MLYDLIFEKWWPDTVLGTGWSLLVFFVAYTGTSLLRGQLKKYHYRIDDYLSKKYGFGDDKSFPDVKTGDISPMEEPGESDEEDAEVSDSKEEETRNT